MLRLVGIGTDGASTNVAGRGLKWLVERAELDFLDVVFSPQTGTHNKGCTKADLVYQSGGNAS